MMPIMYRIAAGAGIGSVLTIQVTSKWYTVRKKSGFLAFLVYFGSLQIYNTKTDEFLKINGYCSKLRSRI